MNTNILDFGAISDGIALNTKAIQNPLLIRGQSVRKNIRRTLRCHGGGI